MRNLCEEDVPIPRRATRDLAGFRAWAVSSRFPEHGRIDFLAGDLEVDMSPEDLHTHGTVKSRIAALLDRLVVEVGLGEVYIDRARISSPWADLSVEPDVVVVFWETLDSGRLRYIPAASGEPDDLRFANSWAARLTSRIQRRERRCSSRRTSIP